MNNLTDILTIIAIFTSPAIAVGVTLWWQRRKEKRDRKLSAFTTLMAHRRTNPLPADVVNSLNLIDIVFDDNKLVLDSWHFYYAKLGEETTQNVIIERKHLFLDLLSAMATDLGLKALKQLILRPVVCLLAAVTLRFCTKCCRSTI